MENNTLSFFQSLWQTIKDIDYTSILLTIANVSFQIIVIILITWVLMKGRKIVINRIFKITKMDEKKENTLSSLLMSITRYVILIIAGIMILTELGIDMAPILASAGILGVAIGFGAQNLVKDIISGFFILFEDWFNVGDYVSIDGISGTVEELGLRTTIIREWSGKQVFLLNSSISKMVNYNREKMRPIINFNIPYEYPTDQVKGVIEEACDKINSMYEEYLLKDTYGNIIEPVQLYGITDVDNNALGAKYTIIGLVKDEAYFLMCKEIRKYILEYLRNSQIQVAYPKRIYSNQIDQLQVDSTFTSEN